MRSILQKFFLFSFSIFLLEGCGRQFTAIAPAAIDPSAQSTSPTNPTNPPVTPPSHPDSILKICSKLNFSQVVWSEQLSSLDRSAFQLALNITGSFEGLTGWSNLTNNFDGQGLSLGLLNQNLGTGSLQPLLIEMRTQHYNQMQSFFSATHFQSLSEMLQTYGASVRLQSLKEEVLPDSSSLDIDWAPAVQLFALSRESASVQWAVQNLYNGTAFKKDWERELNALATSSSYVSIQIRSAQVIHAKARKLQSTLGLNDLRSYLVMFDFVVQNGGLDSQEIPEYQAAVKKNPLMTTQQKLLKILELRLRRVKPRYVADVRSRKMALILGMGVFHGDHRQFEKEYCYSGTLKY